MTNELLYKKATEFQKDCHRSVDIVLSKTDKTDVNVQDATNAWIFRKLAELSLQIEYLENKPSINFPKNEVQ